MSENAASIGSSEPQAGVARPHGQLLPAEAALGEVHLAVTDRERAVAFWTRVLGLVEFPGDSGAVRLGSAAAGSRALIVLHPGASSRVMPWRTGLYHVALHVPTRAELARVVYRLFALRWPNSPTDHLLSETTYLEDPDGNGIELTLETPHRGSFRSTPDGGFQAVTPDGEVRSGRDPVDLESLFAELSPGDDIQAPLATDRVHHVHLHVADLEREAAFYRDLIGFRQQMHVPAFQMVDFAAGPETVVHTLALNTWSGRGALPAPDGTAGLRRFTVAVPDEASVAEVAARLAAAGWPFHGVPGGIGVRDLSGNALQVVVGA